jgi:hypothetical protein
MLRLDHQNAKHELEHIALGDAWLERTTLRVTQKRSGSSGHPRGASVW